MRYELLLQSTVPGEAFPAEAVDSALRAGGVKDQADGGLAWPLKSGVVQVRWLRENDQAIAVELLVPLSDKTSLARELTTAADAVARSAGVTLLDLQLNRPVTEKDAEAVGACYLEAARYAGEMMGVPEALPASFAAQAPMGLKPGTKVVLGLLALFFLLTWLVDVIF